MLLSKLCHCKQQCS